jgi:DNA-binding transcriptional LysR family regulator
MSRWAGIDEFLAVAQAGGFSKGAKTLGRSTSQVSRDIAQLEDRLGVRLLYRTTRQVSVTEAGQQFLQHCQRLVEGRDEAINALRSDDDALNGQLRMTCSVAYGERFIVPLVNSFGALNPRLALDISLTDQVVDLVGERFDLAIRFGELRNSGLVASRLTSRRRLLCASPAYLAAAGTPTTLADLEQHLCLRGASDVWTFMCEGRPYPFRPSGRWRCNSGSAVLDAALQGLGVCRLPDFYVADHLRSGALVLLLDEHRPEDETVWAVRPAGRQAPRKVALLLDYLHDHLRSSAAPGASG